MARISGVNLPNEKRVQIGLTYIYGIGKAVSTKILNQTKIDINKKVKDLTDDEVSRLRAIIENDMRTEGSLRRDVLTDIKRLKEIKSYRGSRHSRSLPARGQRTKTNSRTVRGNVRRTAGSGKKASAQKT
ncbi:30S ribosomal protein S13 [Candidatus Falkowbacteria bacterium RIFOXYA2_FULL_35_8]|uniref:Small ribosomal subunit protein uS13 n=1 Tax=Candidatus Falkowbacteria bacterium RIFOXYC2_FULL_36_12 TaxID=1798002 RepID=A0A1F5SYB9_9BACT|nr:MAG: 30S ribosomal protein S13 [Candidatus Falkowbacteria bacterium RIFOXYB2_FULL_35_7]OGF31717.1 MAG: 30S ribosomal protein S13 [Candidatus Falkowbacteria bacterium RIFOXYC2_FULL_36_12]OGF33158.1 MAG: 30S ribosomal protein S13 [Candidatus Falkowbacteria bacterium RIFOXYA2_FULL_35_8]